METIDLRTGERRVWSADDLKRLERGAVG